ncbi:Hsp20/alpha crystallin family protein [Sphingobacterium kyonggiense]
MFRRNNTFGRYHMNKANCSNAGRNAFDRIQQHFCNSTEGFGFIKDRRNNVAANILENDLYYQVQVFAAGRKKDQFKVAIANQILTISSMAQELDGDLKIVYQETDCGAFERSFQLEDEILLDGIHASYEDGVLTVILKKDPAKQEADVEVAIS